LLYCYGAEADVDLITLVAVRFEGAAACLARVR
jgi:hypothetical protein